MSNAIVTRPQMSMADMTTAASAMHKSGFFSDVKSEAQAIVKVMAGQELGLAPFASMSGIHIVSGKPVLGSNLIATLVANDPRYSYRVHTSNEQECVIAWYEGDEHLGVSTFTRQEAADGNIDKQWDRDSKSWKPKHTWKAYPSDMLFARAISRGARRYAPGIFGGAPVYTPDEMGVDVDPDGFIEGEVVQQPVMGPNGFNPERPLDTPEMVKEYAHGLGADMDSNPFDAKSWGEFTKAYADMNDYYTAPNHVWNTLTNYWDGQIPKFDAGLLVDLATMLATHAKERKAEKETS